MPTVEITASWPLNADVTESTDERSASATETEDGKVEVDEARLTAVTLNLPESTRALRMGAPREPEAWEGKGVSLCYSCFLGGIEIL